MNNSHAKYQYTVEDTINGLTIHYQGRKNWWHVIYSLGLGAFLLYMLFWTISQLLTIPKNEVGLYFELGGLLILGCIVFIYAFYKMVLSALDAMLDIEKLVIDNQHIQVIKSGYRSIERTKVISTDGKANFFYARGFEKSIAIVKTKFFAQLYHSGVLYPHNLDPMQCSLRGISEQDANVIFEKIKARYPTYNILHRNSTYIRV